MNEFGDLCKILRNLTFILLRILPLLARNGAYKLNKIVATITKLLHITFDIKLKYLD